MMSSLKRNLSHKERSGSEKRRREREGRKEGERQKKRKEGERGEKLRKPISPGQIVFINLPILVRYFCQRERTIDFISK